ncbi:hypothetical protein K503DRAFT_777625, partial [Rhizopogon vinicolor AM-OR11-026]
MNIVPPYLHLSDVKIKLFVSTWYDSSQVLVPTTSTGTRIASSVDAEWAFSGGRLQVNHPQHGIRPSRHRSPSDLGSTHPLCPISASLQQSCERKWERRREKDSRRDTIDVDS